MRDEDLKNLPQSIEGWRVAEMFKQLGISDYKNVMELTVEPREIRARVLATDERGHPYAVESTEMIPVLDLGQTEPQFVPGGQLPAGCDARDLDPGCGAVGETRARSRAEVRAGLGGVSRDLARGRRRLAL